MLNSYIRIASLCVMLMNLGYVGLLILQLGQTRKGDMDKVYGYFRVQSLLIMAIYLMSFVVLLNHYGFSRAIVVLFIGELVLLFVVNFVVEQFFLRSSLPLWSISQYLLVIGFIIITRLDITLGVKQFYMAAGAYGVAFLVAFLYRRTGFVKYLGIPAILGAIALLLLANREVGGANNWLQIGDFIFQPSEPVKILYSLFLASVFVLLSRQKRRAVMVAGVFTAGLALIQVFQKDLGSALIYYVVFILMCYVYTTNRMYIIGGGIVTIIAGYFAWLEFSHVQVRLVAWLDPWSDMDAKGYQITQSLFAMGNGGIMGAGLTLGRPDKIPVVTTDFIYAAIYEEMGMVVGMAIIVAIVFFFLFGHHLLKAAKSDFDFLFGSGLLIVYAFQSFLIIGGVTRAVPLTGVTLPFVSYGGSSLVTTFLLLAVLQGIALGMGKQHQHHPSKKTMPTKQKKEAKSKEAAMAIRNKPLSRVKVLFVVMFLGLGANILHFVILQADSLVLNAYNPRLEAMEAAVIRGDIRDRTGVMLAHSVVVEGAQKRHYPFGGLYAHTIGYTAVGKTGLEAYGNLDLIRGSNHFKDQLTAPFKRGTPKANSLVTTLDHGLQQKAYELLGDNRGAIVAMNPGTGEILAMVARPDFDPNTIAAEYEAHLADEAHSRLLNRATQGLYPPGSTFKTITAIAWLEKNLEADFFHYCEGQRYIGQKVIHCYNNKAHGRVSLEDAFATSCNTAFAKMGDSLDRDRLHSIAGQFLYNTKVPFELPVSKSQFLLNADSSPNEVVETVIGQGKTLTTPLNNVMIASAVANGGDVYKPYIVDRVISDDGEVIRKTEPTVLHQVMTPAMAQTLARFMAITSETGTARALNTDNYGIASKTGSAENPHGAAHAWYIGYAPIENPQIALAIVLENAGSSSVHAVPLAGELYEYFLKDH